jgi:hypothetical protein
MLFHMVWNFRLIKDIKCNFLKNIYILKKTIKGSLYFSLKKLCKAIAYLACVNCCDWKKRTNGESCHFNWKNKARDKQLCFYWKKNKSTLLCLKNKEVFFRSGAWLDFKRKAGINPTVLLEHNQFKSRYIFFPAHLPKTFHRIAQDK